MPRRSIVLSLLAVLVLAAAFFARQDVDAIRSRAEQGAVPAQFNLGLLYDSGRGVPQDHKEAAAWYRKAADRGYPAAQFNLGVLYSNGQGLPQNYEEAYFWLNLSAAARPDSAKLRDQIAQRLTPEQLDRAQQRASNWKPAPVAD